MSNESHLDPNKSVNIDNTNQEEQNVNKDITQPQGNQDNEKTMRSQPNVDDEEKNKTEEQNMDSTYRGKESNTSKMKTSSQMQTTKLPYIYTSTSYNTSRRNKNTNGTQSTFYNTNTMNQSNVDSDGLAQELYYCKNKNHVINKEYKELKIEYNKLVESNRTNQRIIEAILRIDPDEEVSEKDLKEKIENSRPNEEETKILKEALSVLILQKRLKACKTELDARNEELNKLKQNSKVIKLREYEAALISQDKDIRRLKDENEKLYKKLDDTNKKTEELKTKYDYYRTQSNQSKSKLKEIQTNYEEEAKKNEDLKKQKTLAVQQVKNKYLKGVASNFSDANEICIYGIAFYKKECQVLLAKAKQEQIA